MFINSSILIQDSVLYSFIVLSWDPSVNDSVIYVSHVPDNSIYKMSLSFSCCWYKILFEEYICAVINIDNISFEHGFKLLNGLSGSR